MANNTSSSPPNSTLLPPPNPSKLHPHISHTSLLFISQNLKRKRRTTPLQASASSFPSSPINVDYLDTEFGGHGISFRGIGDSCVVRMGLDNGSVARLMLPSGLITSYKPKMWHGSTVEVLQTSVSSSEGEEAGEVVIKGGVSLGFCCRAEGAELSWLPRTWALCDVRGNSESSVQVELVSIEPKGMVEVKYLVTLQQAFLGSELTVTNLKPCPLQLTGSVISHLKVSTPDATYAVGLQGSNYSSKRPLKSDFCSEESSGSSRSWGRNGFQGLLPSWGGRDEKSDQGKSEENETEDTEEEEEEEEDDNYAQMTEKMSRIYTSAPREFTVIDRGRRNSVVVERRGFDEFYIFSPGSRHEWYGKYAYICIGPSAMLTPVILGPEDVWRGGQYLHNPNM